VFLSLVMSCFALGTSEPVQHRCPFRKKVHDGPAGPSLNFLNFLLF